MPTPALRARIGFTDSTRRYRFLSEVARAVVRDWGRAPGVVLERVGGSPLRLAVHGFPFGPRYLWCYYRDEPGTHPAVPLTDGQLDLLRAEITNLMPYGGPQMATVTKRCFEYRDPPSHNKFWTIQIAGTTAFVTYGKIGSGGATQVKPFGSDRQVQDFADKMIREKTGKGYREVPASRHPGAPQQQVDAAAGTVTATAAPAARRGGTTDGSRPEDGDRFLDL